MQWIVVKISVNRTKHIAPFLPSPFPVKHGDIGQYRVRLMNQPSKDYYSLLGVSPSSPQEHLKATYRKLLLSVHPDKQLNDSKDGQNKSAQISVQDLVDIWKVLGDPIERRKYDMYIFKKKLEKTNASLIFKKLDIDEMLDDDSMKIFDSFAMDELNHENELIELKSICRCGGIYQMEISFGDLCKSIQSDQMEECVQYLIGCTNCSFNIIVKV